MYKLLEAIQKGIQLGLEIQDDELDQPIFQKSEVTSDVHVQRADKLKWIRENFVDLGLPSGNLWCKWNLGATNGSTKESWYGNYYAWGEVETKENFGWKNYKYWDGSTMTLTLTKYNDIDRKEELDPEDDAVTVAFGKNFKMPSKEDIEELCSLQNVWVRDYNGIYGLNGRVFTGNNGNKLFIPASGYRYGSHFNYVGSYCDMWSCCRHSKGYSNAYNMFFYSDDTNPSYCDYRYYGQSVRGIMQLR